MQGRARRAISQTLFSLFYYLYTFYILTLFYLLLGFGNISKKCCISGVVLIRGKVIIVTVLISLWIPNGAALIRGYLKPCGY